LGYVLQWLKNEEKREGSGSDENREKKSLLSSREWKKCQAERRKKRLHWRKGARNGRGQRRNTMMLMLRRSPYDGKAEGLSNN